MTSLNGLPNLIESLRTYPNIKISEFVQLKCIMQIHTLKLIRFPRHAQNLMWQIGPLKLELTKLLLSRI